MSVGTRTHDHPHDGRTTKSYEEVVGEIRKSEVTRTWELSFSGHSGYEQDKENNQYHIQPDINRPTFVTIIVLN